MVWWTNRISFNHEKTLRVKLKMFSMKWWSLRKQYVLNLFNNVSRAYGIQLSCDMLNLKEYVIWKRGKLQKYLPINRALLNFKISQQVPTLNRVLFRPTYKRGKWWFFIFIVQSIILIVLTWNTKAIQTRPVMDRFHDSSKHLTMF